MSFWDVAKKVIGEADIVVVVVDVRFPELSVNPEIEAVLRKYDKPHVVVFNKMDLVSEDYLKALRKLYWHALFVSGTKNRGMKLLKTKLMIMGSQMKKNVVKVGVVGYPNVGKSAVINALSKSGKTKVSAKAGTTTGMQFVKATERLKIIDSPGVIPLRDDELTLAILGAKNPEKLKNIEMVATAIIQLFLDHNKEALEHFYETALPDDAYECLVAIGKKRGSLLKGGVVDERRMAFAIVRDWQRGKLLLEQRLKAKRFLN